MLLSYQIFSGNKLKNNYNAIIFTSLSPQTSMKLNALVPVIMQSDRVGV